MKKSDSSVSGKRRRFLIAAVFLMWLGMCGLWIWKESTERDFQGEDIVCKPNSPISWEERIDPAYRHNYGDRLQCLEAGDILITPCSHTFGWRNGHAAIVIDDEKGLTLESVVLGTPSSVQSVEKWRSYPGVAVLRLKGVSAQERGEIASYAAAEKQNVPYGFAEELLEHISDAKGRDTHCAHLVWEVYMAFGYDLDGDGGMIVTPRDLWESPLLEVVEAYGMDCWK